MLSANGIRTALLFCLGCSVVHSVYAENTGGVDFSGSGFLTLSAGKMLSGTRGAVLDRNCPCFVADYAEGAVYDGRGGLQFGPDSRLGLQGKAESKDANLSATVQVIARGADGDIDLEWLYGTYQLADNTVIQFGRKRLPLFYYSDVQDVGFALPWTHLPPQVYGWEAVNYNGLSLQHQTKLAGWSASFNVLAGSENVNDSGYWKIYNGKASRTQVKWGNIVGGDVTLSRDWFETRLVYIQSTTKAENLTGIWNANQQTYVPTTDPALLGLVSRQRIYGAAFNADVDDWMVRSEFLYIDRTSATFKDSAELVALGRRFGKWQLFGTVSHYGSIAVVSAGGDPQNQENHTNRSITLRYDLTPTSDIKLQLDSQQGNSGALYSPNYGDAQLLTAAYDRVF